MKTRKILALVLSLVMVFSLCSTAFAAHLTDEVTELEQTNSDLSMELATNAYVLFENNGVLPLDNVEEKAIAVFGSAAEYTIKGGTGSGDVNQRARDHIDEAFTAAGWELTNPTWIAKMAEQDPPAGCFGNGPKNDLVITDAEMAEAAAGTDLAVYAIARNAGEFADRNATGGDYYLSDLERANLEAVAANFEDVIVVLNTCVVDTKFIDEIDNIDAVLYMGNGGQRGAEALVKVLTGEVTPSGKLTDTWPINIEDYPSYEGFGNNDGNQNTEWYYEGIYNGYRYFDTWGMDVAYEFGFGGSYTEFDIDVVDVAIDSTTVEVVVDVTNVGSEYSGKEVVQVYFSAPDGRLEKPYQELAAYGKTDELEPGEKQTLTLTFATEDMSSYDEELAAYIMDAGQYIIRVGNSSRNTQVVATATLAEMTITEQLSNQIVPEVEIEEWSKEGQTPITYAGEAEEIANAPKFVIAAEDLPFANNASEYDDETATTYLFEEDAANYEASPSLTLRTKVIAGNLENVTSRGGYAETTYAEVVEVVDALPEGITKETAKLTDVYTGKITMEQFMACLSAYELSRICVGGAGTPVVGPNGEQVGGSADSVDGGAGQTTMELLNTRHIPSMPNADGPAGIRITQSYTKNGVRYYQFCTAFPAGTCMAGTWDVDLNYLMGEAIGKEMIEYGVTTWLAPALNIHRNALCGRNFEYFSEDPYVSGMVSAHLTAGVQATPGIGVTLKHFWGNSQETNRNAENNVISERAAREIYLKGFEICVKLAQPTCIMNCYNGNNGWPGSDDFDTNWDITRGEWGFKGYVMTDWGGGQSTPHVAKHGGCDMVMPGSGVNQVSNYIGIVEPTFNAADGSIANVGSFEAAAGGAYEYTVTVEGGYDAVAQSVRTAVAAGQASVSVTADGAVVTWYGNHVGRIALGDVQKSAINILNVAIQSKDMVNLGNAIDMDIEITPWTELHNAPLANGWTQATKGEVVNTSVVADTVVAACEDGEAVVNVTYEGDVAITSARIAINSELPVANIASDYVIENNNNGYVVIYAEDGSEISGVLCTITYDISGTPWLANGEYPVDIEVVEATDGDINMINLTAVDGAVIIANNYPAGDANLDGAANNADLVAIARYLVNLIELEGENLEAADFDANGVVNNADLVKLARFIVSAEFAYEASATYTVVVEGFDWGAASTKLILNVDKIVDAKSVDAGDFTVLNTMQGCNGSSTSTRKVTAAYTSDAEGNQVATPSNYVAIDMYVSPNDGGAFYYDMRNGGLNKWPDPYYFTVNIAGETGITSRGVNVTGLNVEQQPANIVCPLADQFEQTEFKASDDIVLNYGAWSPAKDSAKNPLIIWLHGAGEGGTDNDIVAMGNKVVNLITDEIQQYFTTEEISGAYVLTPQSPTMWMNDGSGNYTNDGTSMYTKALMELIESYVAGNPDIDTNRIYIGGCSNGGYMTMNMIMTYPEYFAAAYPVCEAYTDKWITDAQIEAIKDLPIWFTHAANDTTVDPTTHTVATYNRLVEAGAENVHFSFFEDVHDTTGEYTQNDGTPYQYMGHWSWIYTLNNECVEEDGTTIMAWMASQVKG